MIEREFEPAAEVLQGILDRLAHPAPVFLGPVTGSLHDLWRRRFESAGNVGGDPWEELSAETLKKKEKDGMLDEGILVGTGILRASLTEDSLSSFAEMHDDTTLGVGTLDPVAGLHEYGVPGRLPKRSVLPSEIPSEDLSHLEDLVADYIVEGTLDEGAPEVP